MARGTGWPASPPSIDHLHPLNLSNWWELNECPAVGFMPGLPICSLYIGSSRGSWGISGRCQVRSLRRLREAKEFLHEKAPRALFPFPFPSSLVQPLAALRCHPQLCPSQFPTVSHGPSAQWLLKIAFNTEMLRVRESASPPWKSPFFFKPPGCGPHRRSKAKN